MTKTTSRGPRKGQGSSRIKPQIQVDSGINSGGVGLAVSPISILAASREALHEAEARLYRQRLIEKADHTCQKCSRVAWSVQRMGEMQTRPKESVAGKPSTGDWVWCGKCSAAHDAKKRKRAS